MPSPTLRTFRAGPVKKITLYDFESVLPYGKIGKLTRMVYPRNWVFGIRLFQIGTIHVESANAGLISNLISIVHQCFLSAVLLL